MSFTRHLLVDGANILHAWKNFEALFQRDRDAARSQLAGTLAAIHDTEQVRVTIVFDGRGDSITMERPSQQPTFSILYTPSSLTADDVIEQIVANSADPGTCVVATEDSAERETVIAAGATAIRAADLLAWVARAEARQSAALESVRAANKKSWPPK